MGSFKTKDSRQMNRGRDLSGMLAIVTGGSKGIGRAIGITLAQRGCRIVLLARGASALNKVVEQINYLGAECYGLQCDLSEHSEVTAVFKRIRNDYGPVNILVNNAGLGSFGPFERYSDEQLDRGILVPALAAMHTSHQVVSDMIDLREGWIINILTPAAYFPLPYMAPYTASRWALNGFSQSLHLELKSLGVHVGTVCPGRVDTEYVKHNDTDIGWWPKIRLLFPLVSAEEVANKVVHTIEHKKREVIFPALLLFFVRTHGFFPKTVVQLLELLQIFKPSIDPATSNNTTVRNWEQSIDLKPQSVVYAETVRDIVGVVNQPTQFPSPVRTAGSRHSTTHCGVTDSGTLLSTVKMNRVIDIDVENLTVTAQAGALYIDVAKALEWRQLQFFVNVEIGNLTMGSAACTGTKDASFHGEKGQVCSYLISARLILADGTELLVDEREPELLQAVRSSYGLLGVIHEVTFRVKPLCALEFYHRTYTLDEFEKALPALRREQTSMMYYLYPFAETLTVEFRCYNPKRQPSGRLAWYLRNMVWKTIAPAFSALVTRWISNRVVRFFLLDNFYHLLQFILSAGIKSRSSFASDQIIRYPESKGLSKYTFSIWAFPENDIMATMRAYYRFCQEYYHSTGYRCDILNVGYRIEKDQNPMFSYSWHENVMTLDPVCSGNEAGWDDFLKAYNRFCSAHNGVPLFNQSKWLTPEQVEKAFGERIKLFSGYRRKLDPTDRFLNDYFRTLFESSAEHPLASGHSGIAANESDHLDA